MVEKAASALSGAIAKSKRRRIETQPEAISCHEGIASDKEQRRPRNDIVF